MVFYWCEEWAVEDAMSEETPEDRSTRLVLESMNSILDFLVFTRESPNDFEDKKLPTLDIKIWLKDIRIWYQFYQKPMCNNIVIQANSALSETVKVSSLTEEVVRRLKHTREDLPISYRLETLEDICQRMKNSGHRENFMRRIITAGIVKYERKLKNSKLEQTDKKYRPLHQPSG